MKNIVVFGMGKLGRKYVNQDIRESIQLTDNNSLLWGKELSRGGVVKKPTDILWSNCDFVVITAGEDYQNDIFNQLTMDFKVDKEKILFYYETIVVSEDVLNLGNMKFKKNAAPDLGSIIPKRELKNMLDANAMNDLEKFFFYEEHNCIGKWLHYFEAYDRFFQRYRGKDVNILEIGVSGGGSLQMWKRYFKTGENSVKVYGIDIDPGCKQLEEDGISIFTGSQEDRNFLREIKEKLGSVDILIDDGGHTMKQQIVTFEELFELVADDGIYLCEDLHTSYMKHYGGGYRGDTFIEYSKNLIDYLHAQYSETGQLVSNIYSESIKFITYCDSMIFIEKKSRTMKSDFVHI